MGEPVRDCDFWRGPLEADTYIAAVKRNPRRDDEVPWAYLQRISEIVQTELCGMPSHSAAWDAGDWRGM